MPYSDTQAPHLKEEPALRVQQSLHGVNAVLVTAFRSGTGPVDSRLTTEVAHRCDKAGVHAVTALGNTAELYQLTSSERSTVLRAAAEGCDTAVRIAGVAGALAEALSLAEEAAASGYHAVMVHEPLDPLASEHGLVDFLTQFADRSPLPCVLYVRTPRLGIDALGEIVQHPAVAGIKYARADLAGLAMLRARDETRDACVWACGSAESMVPAMRGLGLTGFTSGLANVRPDLALRVWEASRSGDMDELAARVRTVLPFEHLRVRDGGRHNVAVVKWALRWAGIEVGDVRPPCSNLDEATASSLEAILRSWPEGPSRH